MGKHGEILPHDGATIAYTVVDRPAVAGICVHVVKCHPDDRFEYDTGRKLAAKKLKEEGPVDVLSLTHPISETIVDWFANQWCPSRRKYAGYAIDVIRDRKFRWLSRFTPSQSEIRGT